MPIICVLRSHAASASKSAMNSLCRCAAAIIVNYIDPPSKPIGGRTSALMRPPSRGTSGTKLTRSERTRKTQSCRLPRTPWRAKVWFHLRENRKRQKLRNEPRFRASPHDYAQTDRVEPPQCAKECWPEDRKWQTACLSKCCSPWSDCRDCHQTVGGRILMITKLSS